MQKSLKLSIAMLLISAFTSFGQKQARLLRFPTTNGTDVVFSYAGDLYKAPLTGGEAVRLTSHVGYEMFPKFSPDGKTIAFTGEYDGNTEVYTVPVDGGEPLRITYTSNSGRDNISSTMGSNNIVMGWTPDGKKIVYRNRNPKGGGFVGQLYTVPKDGGLSTQIPLPEGGFCSYSPDGSKLAYNKVMREFRAWKYYRGGMADDIWVYDPAAETVSNITDNDAQDIIPMWIGENIFFLSDRDRTMNMFVYDTNDKSTSKVTEFTEFDIKFPSAHGNTIVFENGGYIYKMDATERVAEKVNITLSSDNIYARSVVKDGANYVSYVSLSPDGKRLAVTARGEVFDVPAEKGVTRNITHTPGAHERRAKWSPDGKYIAYISDITGESEIWMLDITDKNSKPKQLTKDNDTYIWNLIWSPDSKSILYTDRHNRMILLDVSSKKKSVVFNDPAGLPTHMTFSPDSKWLTYNKLADNDYYIVYVYNIASKKEYPITDRWYTSTNPIFSTDGKYLFFNSLRDIYPLMGGLGEYNYVTSASNGMYMALLEKDTPSPFLNKDPEVNAKEESAKKEDKVNVKIDFDGLSDRIVKIDAGSGSPVYSDGKKLYYTFNGETWAYDLGSKSATKYVSGIMTVQPGSKKALFSSSGRYYVSNIPSMPSGLGKVVSFSDMKIKTDFEKEWKQIFNEGWRVYRDGFYVANMHGVDWPAMRKKYEVLLPYVKNRLDLNYVLAEMVAELNVGHCYIASGEAEFPKIIKTGLLGAEITRHKSGFFRIEKILPGASWSSKLRSPLTEPGIEAEKGDYIVAIDGVPTNTVKDMYSLLTGKANVLTELSLNDKPKLAGARKVVIVPLESENALYRHEWVQNNIKKVEKATNGRVGYIYIPDMGTNGLTEFAKYFYPQLDKEGLIIDDRANGGGNVSPMILERLSREAYRLTMRRGSNHIGTVPDAVQTGPKVCLIDKYSASDGDLFPWGFRALGIGKLIGTRTWGGIVGINGSLPYMDGSYMTVPMSTSYDPKTGDWIIENHGVDPDIWVDNDPLLEYKGVDQQLDRAIEEVMKDLENRKPLPPVPAPRVWNK